jgi:hypothetical protein
LQQALCELRHDCYDRALCLGTLRPALREGLARRCAHLASAAADGHAPSHADASAAARAPVTPARALEGPFDLVVLANVLHTFDEPAIEQLAQALRQQHSLDGSEYLAIHQSPLQGQVLSSDEATDFFIESIGATSIARRRRDGYRVDHWHMG